MIFGLVLCGGRSRRMGRDKATVLWQGEPLTAHVSRTLREVCDEVWLALRHGQDAPVPDLAQVRDAGTGPLGALAAGLARAGPENVILAVACDMPLVSAGLLSTLVARLPGHDVAVPVCDGVPQVVCAAWAGRLAEQAEELMSAGSGAPRDLLARAVAAYLPAETWRHQLRSVEQWSDLTILSG